MSNLINILESDNYEIIKEYIEKNREDIIKNKEDIEVKDKYNNILINYLEYNNNPSIDIIKLLEKEKDIFGEWKYNPLICYCSNSNIKNINKEIINYFTNQIGIHCKYNGCITLVYYIGYNKNPTIDIIKLLEKDIFGEWKYNPLICYCSNLNIEKLNPEIIKYYENQIGKQNDLGETALIYYLKYNKNPSIEIIKLLEKEKDISIINNTLLMYYCMNENIEKLNPEIIEYFSNQIGKQNDLGGTALLYYLKYNKKIIIENINILYKEIGYINFKKYNIEIDLDIY